MIAECVCCGFAGEVSDKWYSLCHRKRVVDRNPPTIFICEICLVAMI